MTLRSIFSRSAVFAAATLTTLAAPAAVPATAADARVTQDFDANWLFSRGDFPSAMMRAFDDSVWRQVNVPHDWSIEGPFSADYGSGNGYAPGGIGWYRKYFKMDSNQKDRTVAIEFDGVYDWSEVWVNGQFVGGRPYGFSSFQFDVAPTTTSSRCAWIIPGSPTRAITPARAFTGTSGLSSRTNCGSRTGALV